jgi:hypothetical protein
MLVDWVFASRQTRVEKGLCCDVCHARRCPPSEHVRFICDALQVEPPEPLPKRRRNF